MPKNEKAMIGVNHNVNKTAKFFFLLRYKRRKDINPRKLNNGVLNDISQSDESLRFFINNVRGSLINCWFDGL